MWIPLIFSPNLHKSKTRILHLKGNSVGGGLAHAKMPERTHLGPHSCRESQDRADGHYHKGELPSSDEPHYESCKKRGYCLKEHSNLVTNSFTDFGDVTKKDHTYVVTGRRSSVRKVKQTSNKHIDR